MSDGWQPAVDNLQSQINSIRSQISVLSGQENSQAAQISLLISQLSALQTEVSIIQQQVAQRFTILSVTATGQDRSGATQLEDLDHDWTIYLVTNPGNGSNGLILPNNAVVGAVVEFHTISGPTPIVYSSSDSNWDGLGVGSSSGYSVDKVMIRKTESAYWRAMVPGNW